MQGEVCVIRLSVLLRDTLYRPELLCPIQVMLLMCRYRHHDSWLLYSSYMPIPWSCPQYIQGRLMLCHIHLSYHQDAVQDMLFPSTAPS